MKPIIFFAAALWASLAPLYAKAQCAVQPSCSSLGYTYTGSTSDCVNTPMKAPLTHPILTALKKQMSSNNLNPIGQKKELSAKEAFIPHQADLSLANFLTLINMVHSSPLTVQKLVPLPDFKNRELLSF
ncbi:MAG: hypothetical protein ACLSE6_06245 [Alphaproteobacteria bacterium]